MGARGRAKATPQGRPHPAQPMQSRPRWNLVLYSPLHSPTQKSHPALPTPSTPASRQQDQSHQGRRHCSFTSWKNGTSKCRNRQNQRTVGLPPPGSCGSLGSGPRPGAASAPRIPREHPHKCPHRALAEACSIFVGKHSTLGLLKTC